MAENADFIDQNYLIDDFIREFFLNLNSIDPKISSEIEFKMEVQKKNLYSLVEEAKNKISKYEEIYPYIKSLCQNQSINPALFKNVETVLNWALKKGRGRSRVLSEDIKNAWITYIVILSYSMIDKNESNLDVSRNIFLKTDKGKIVGLTGNN